MIEKLFEGERSREQIKNKFRKEERENKAHIDKLLANKAGLTLKDFEAQFGPLKLGKKDENEQEIKGESSSSLDMMSSGDSENSDDGESDSSDSEKRVKPGLQGRRGAPTSFG
jgi:hypothetical protein